MLLLESNGKNQQNRRKTMKKRIVSLLLCLCMAVSLLSGLTLTASADEQWLWPVEGCYVITTCFGAENGSDYHHGIDIARYGDATGYPVRAAKSGTIYSGTNTYADDTFVSGSAGNHTMVDHGDGTCAVYMHMRPGNKISGTVRQGEIIGYVGNTGESYGAHLHFEIYTDPTSYYTRKSTSLNSMPTNSNITIIDNSTPRSGLPTQRITYLMDLPSAVTLSTPTNLTGVRSGTNDVQLNWNAVSGAERYEAQYYSWYKNDWTTLDESPAYTNSLLAKGFTWDYDYVDFRVRAVNSTGVSEWAQVRVEKTASSGSINYSGLTRIASLDVVAYPQTLEDSCSAAAAKAVLNYFGKAADKTDADLYSTIQGLDYQISNTINQYLGDNSYTYTHFSHESRQQAFDAIKTSILTGNPAVIWVGGTGSNSPYFPFNTTGHYTTVSAIYTDANNAYWLELKDSYSGRYTSADNQYRDHASSTILIPFSTAIEYMEYTTSTNNYSVVIYSSVQRSTTGGELDPSTLSVQLNPESDSIRVGGSFYFTGTVSSNYNLEYVKASSDNAEYAVVSDINASTYEIVKTRSCPIYWDYPAETLPAGVHTLTVEAKDASGKTATATLYVTVGEVPHSHSYSGTITTQPTCTEEGVKTYTCGCGDTYTASIAPLGHSLSYHAATDSDIEYWTCSACGARITDISVEQLLNTASGALGKKADYFGFTADWCALFVGWCTRQVGASSRVGTASAYPSDFAEYVLNNKTGSVYYFQNTFSGTYDKIGAYLRRNCSNVDNLIVAERSSFLPVAGDLICFLWEESAEEYAWSHIGIVESVKDGIVYYYEGNAEGYETDTTEYYQNSHVKYNHRALSDLAITCYIRPNYTSAQPTPEPIPDAPTVSVIGGKARPGKTVTVALDLADNTGLAGMRLSLAYDSALTLTSVTAGDALTDLTFTKPGDLTANPVSLFWDGMDADETNGTIVTLTFTVAEGAEDGDYPITVTYKDSEVYDGDLENVALNVVNGSVTVKNYMLGDVNDDDEVNGKDVTILRRYFAGGYGVTINELAADVNGDGEANGKDVTILRRYFAGGYGVTLE